MNPVPSVIAADEVSTAAPTGAGIAACAAVMAVNAVSKRRSQPRSARYRVERPTDSAAQTIVTGSPAGNNGRVCE